MDTDKPATASGEAPESSALASGRCHIVTWNVNALMPTVANIRLRHGSMLGFLDFLEADIICLQVCPFASIAGTPLQPLTRLPAGDEAHSVQAYARGGVSG